MFGSLFYPRRLGAVPYYPIYPECVHSMIYNFEEYAAKIRNFSERIPLAECANVGQNVFRLREVNSLSLKLVF